MENISTSQLQALSNILHKESSASLRYKIQAWVQAKNTDPEQVHISTLAGLASQSSIKDEILSWVDGIINPGKMPGITVPVEEAIVAPLPEEVAEVTPEVEITPEAELPKEEPPVTGVKKTRKTKNG